MGNPPTFSLSFFPELQNPNPELGMVVVIPCHDEPDLISSLESLHRCIRPECAVEVIVVINSGEQHGQDVMNRNRGTMELASKWIAEHREDRLTFFTILAENLPAKFAGVGLARKIGMDEASRRLEQTNPGNGIVVCFDADCSCDPDYFTAIENAFRDNPKAPGASIYFEHPLHGDSAGIIRYELFLRYFVQALRWSGFPFAFHTVGSAMAVRSGVYRAVGGMNKKKAGEDFYFLHKVMPRGHFLEINSTRVIPSPRVSHRVPFGTGKAMADWQNYRDEVYPVYNFQSFRDLKIFLSKMESELFRCRAGKYEAFLDSLPASVVAYLSQRGFMDKIVEIQNNSRHMDSFRKRFYAWFDGLAVLQFFHFSRENAWKSKGLEISANEFLESAGLPVSTGTDLLDILCIFRRLDREN